MSHGLRILHLADSHIGAQLPARPRTDRPTRGDDFVHSYRRVLLRAREFDVDLVVHAGDVFDEPNPSLAAIAAAGEPLLALAADGIPVVIIPGNHERSILPGSLLFAHPNLFVVRDPTTLRFTLRGRSIAIAAVPCIRRESATRFGPALAAAGWENAAADLNLLIAHQSFDCAVCGSANYRFRPGDDVVDRSSIPDGFHYVAAGHVHRHQGLPLGHIPRTRSTRRKEPRADTEVSMFSAKPPRDDAWHDAATDRIVYAGSPDRITFAERDEPKGCVLIEECGTALRWRFLAHDVRPMASLPLDVSGLNASQIRHTVLRWLGEQPPGAIAQVRLSGRATPRAMRGLALAQHARELRSDILFDASSQAIEWAPERDFPAIASLPTSPARDSDAAIWGRWVGPPHHPSKIERFDRDALHEAPRRAGTYAFFAADGRLLYVGKANALRSRIRQHLQSKNPSGFFAGWVDSIARVECRIAASEIEALLVEAELIRRLRPPFNRQFRQWARYRYLAPADAYGTLRVCIDPPDDRICYGPYGSTASAEMIAEVCGIEFGTAHCPPNRDHLRLIAAPVSRLCDRFFTGACRGPCGGKINPDDYRLLLSQRHSLLAGEDDRLVIAAETRSEANKSSADDVRDALRQRASVLRLAYDSARLLRTAATALAAGVRLPGPPGFDAFVAVRAGEIEYALVPQGAACPWEGSRAMRGRIAGEALAPPGDTPPASERPCDKSLADMYKTLARALEPRPEVSPNLPV